jgi:hypothetical protein
MRSLSSTIGLVFSEALLAHPGHGMPGWIHPHVADYALIAFGVFCCSLLVYFARKALKR